MPRTLRYLRSLFRRECISRESRHFPASSPPPTDHDRIHPDRATGARDPIGAVPVDRPVETPEVEPKTSSLKISILKAGADQADWLKEIDATGEIIYGYEIFVR